MGTALCQGYWETWLFFSHRNPSNSDPQEPTYYNVPGWIELQPVYSNGEDQGPLPFGQGPQGWSGQR